MRGELATSLWQIRIVELGDFHVGDEIGIIIIESTTEAGTWVAKVS